MIEYLIHQTSNFSELSIVLPGANEGFCQSLLFKILNRLVKEKRSVLSYNYPYWTREESHSSGEELMEEIAALKEVLALIDLDKYQKVNFIGKSLGGIVAAKFLKLTENQELLEKSTLAILGYDTGMIDLSGVECRTVIIQGEKDKFGNIEAVKADVSHLNIDNFTFIEIPDADHSYRNDKGEYEHEDRALEALFAHI